MKLWTAGLALTATLLAAGAAAAQDAPAMARIVEEGPQWGAFARDSQRIYLVDMASIMRDGDVATASIVRLRREASAGDYSHIVNVFQVKCEAAQSRLLSSTDIEEDGSTGRPETTDEPFFPIRAGTLDSQVRDIACGEMAPTGNRYPSIKEYVDEGRP